MAFQPGAKAMEWRLLRERHFTRISCCRVNGTSVNGSPPGRGQKRALRLFPDDQRNTLTQRIDAFLCALMESVTLCMKSPASQAPLSEGGLVAQACWRLISQKNIFRSSLGVASVPRCWLMSFPSIICL